MLILDNISELKYREISEAQNQVSGLNTDVVSELLEKFHGGLQIFFFFIFFFQVDHYA